MRARTVTSPDAFSLTDGLGPIIKSIVNLSSCTLGNICPDGVLHVISRLFEVKG